MTRQTGLSLIELMLVLLIGSTLLGIALPSFSSLLDKQRAVSAHNELLATIQLARTRAITDGRPTVVCPSRDGLQCAGGGVWENGWISFVDNDSNGFVSGADKITRVDKEGMPQLMARSSQSRPKVSFTKRGASAGNNISIRICDATGKPLQALIINNGGRARVAQHREISRLQRCE